MAYGLRKVEAVAEGITWEEVKNKLETEGAKNKAYDSDVDGVLDLAVIPVITRSKLEYPTEDVTFAYLAAINKTELVEVYYSALVATVDEFTDKAIQNVATGDAVMLAYGRYNGSDDSYYHQHAPTLSTADHRLIKLVGGSESVLASESVDLNDAYGYLYKLSISGSTLKGYRSDMTTEKISATDTSFASGKWGVGTTYNTRYGSTGSFGAKLLAPSSPLTKPKGIVECEITGSGTSEDPFRPNLKQELSKHDKFGNIDKLSITWGAFDHKPEHNTMLICITGGNAYTGDKAIEKQIEHAKRKNLKVVKPPRDYHEACRVYSELRKEFDFIAGKDNFAYMTLGHEDFEAMQAADTYYGRIIDMGDKKAYKNVPEFEMRRTLAMWKERLKRAKVMKSEANKHIEKIEKVERVGW